MLRVFDIVPGEVDTTTAALFPDSLKEIHCERQLGTSTTLKKHAQSGSDLHNDVQPEVMMGSAIELWHRVWLKL